MPFTPFHWGPSSWIGLVLFRYLNLYVFLIANVIVDIEPFCVIAFNLRYPLHGFFHTFMGGTIAAVFISVILYRGRRMMNKAMSFLRLSQESSFKTIFLSVIAGVYFHIFLDAFLYTDIKPLYPITVNPLYGLVSHKQMYLFCSYSFIVGALLYFVKIPRRNK